MRRDSASVLMERFPALGLMAGTWGSKPLKKEPLPPLDLGNVELLYFYGLGRGEIYAAVKSWLDASPTHQLVLLEDDPALISSFLDLPEAVEILSHPQVHLEMEFAHLAEKFPVQRIEVAGLASKKGVAKLRLELLRKTALSHALRLDRLYGYQPFLNFVKNLRHLPRSFYANGLKGAFTNVPAIVCGAGPSLDIPVLKELENRALLIAGGSTLAALSSQGVLPHFGMAIDPNLEEYKRLKNSFAFEVPFLYSTRVHPGVFQTCSGPFGYMRGGIGGALELWMEEELGLLDPLLGEKLAPETISVTGICLAWAQFLGCNPILLNGVDLAYTGKRHYARGVVEEKKIVFEEIDREKSAADRILRRKDRNGKTIYTAVRWVMESASISQFAKEHPEVRFINTSAGGLGFKGIDYVPLQKAVSTLKEQNLRARVYEEIAKHPMPQQTEAIITQKMGELKESLARVIDALRILSGEKKGSSALAELELKEEIAYLYLFYDIYQVLKAGPDFWKNWLSLALKYQEMFYEPIRNL